MRLLFRRLLWSTAALAGGILATAAAAQPFVVSDLTTPEIPAQPLDPRDFASLGEIALFSSDGPLGREPWRTDGTPEGTWPLADVCPGLCSSFIEPLGLLDGHLFFFVGPFGRDGWLLRTDGTIEGTVPLDGPFREMRWLGTSGDRALLLGGGRLTVWGTEGGEPLLKLRPFGQAAVESGGRLWLAGDGLWVSDGTEAGTRQVSNRSCSGLVAVGSGVTCWSGDDLLFNSGGESQQLVELGLPSAGVKRWTEDGRGRAFYVIGSTGSGDQLWVTDGTVSASRHLDAPLELGEIRGSDGRLFFAARDAAGVELWTTDGRPGNSRRQADLCPGSCSSSPRSFTPAGRGLLFVASTPTGEPALWYVEGGTQAPRLLATTDLSGSSGALSRVVEHGGDLYVGFDNGLFRVEPDLDVHEIVPTDRFSFYAPDFAIAGDAIVFADRERLWRTDGTAAGAMSLSSEGSSSVNGSQPDFALVAHRDEVCVEAGRVWCGDAAGLRAGVRRQFFDAVLHSAGDVLFAVTHNEVVAFPDPAPQPVLTGSVEHEQAAVLRGELYFFGGSSGTHALWRSDGTPEGTRLVAGPMGGASGLLVLGDRLLFAAAGLGDKKLWSSDGTFGGTFALPVEVERLAPFPTPASFRGAAWFVAERRLWRSDGTVAGTVPALDLEFVRDGAYPWTVIATRDRLFVIGGSNIEMWTTDGSTPPVELLELGHSFDMESIAVVGSRLFFAADHPDLGNELWVTDGTPTGTRVLDLFPGPFPSSPRHPSAVGDFVLFAAHDLLHGRELWISDGTQGGSRRLSDVAPGWASSEPRKMTRVGDHLYFLADDGVAGTEVWAMDWESATRGGRCRPSATRLCLGGGRFAVTVRWRDPYNGGEGNATARPFSASDQSGVFWFFDPGNVELIVKALDGTPLNGHHWLFYGALTTVEYWIDVTDTATGERRRYHNPAGQQCGRGDTTAFAGATSGAPSGASPGSFALGSPVAARASAGCDGLTALCLLGGSLRVEVDWHDPRSGDRGRGVPFRGSDNTGYFWFFDAANVELVVKALDGTPVNGHRWIFYGGLSDVEYEIRVTDVASGASRTYRNPFGEICGGADTAF